MATILGNAQADPVPLYTVTPISGIFGRALNDLGQVAGYVNSPGGNVAATWSSGTVTVLGTLPGGGPTAAFGINNSGQVVGFSGPHAFLYSDGSITDLGTLPGGNSSLAFGINNSGQVVGTSYTSAGAAHAFLYSSGIMTDLGTLPGGSNSYAGDINNSGQVAGSSNTESGATHLFLYDNGVMSDLGAPPGATGGVNATAINDSGQIVGWSSNAGLLRGFIYINGVINGLGAAGPCTTPSSINNPGQVVGLEARGYRCIGAHAFLYSDGVMTDLNSLIDPSLHIFLTDAQAINNAGQILAYGPGSFADVSYLLTPVPEPSAWPLCAGGLIALAVVRSWRNQSHPRQPSERK